MNLFSQIISVEGLRAGFKRVARNQGGPGGDQEAIGAFAYGLEANLEALNTMLADGSYWPAPLRLVDIPKKSGGLRRLSIPSVRDRTVQASAHLVLSPILEPQFSDDSFGYRPGRSVQQAVDRVSALRREGFVWTVDGDIRAFFDSVPHARLLERAHAMLGCERTVDLIARWLEAYSPGAEGIPQGGPISPLLANVYLDAVDDAIASNGVRLVRFADDFLLLCRNEIAAEGALGRMADLLAEHGLGLNPDKTRIRPFTEATTFLGHMFLRSITLPERYAEEVQPQIEKLKPQPEAEPPADRLRWLYIVEPGRVVTRRNMSLSITDGVRGPEVIGLQPGWADGIEIGPGARIDDEALRLALSAGTLVRWLDGGGDVIGTATPPNTDRAGLHLAQARLVSDPIKSVSLAARLVMGRMQGQRAQLYRLNRDRKDPEIKGAANDVGRLARLARIQTTIDGLRGVEGRAAALYWKALSRCVNPPFRFDARRRRPPPDPVNLVISILAMRLSADMEILIRRAGLHPGFSVLHSVQDGRPSLALDLIETYRAPLSEGLAVQLFNQRKLRPEMFTKAEDGRLKATASAMRRIIEGYEAAAQRRVRDSRLGHRTSWRGVMEEDCQAIRREAEGIEPFRPFERDF